MTLLRRLSWLALGLAFVHSVFGAIVRISGSGMGCGEHWPDCNGTLLPAATSYTVVVEFTHRCLAVTLLAVTAAIVVLAVSRRHAPDVGGRGGVLRPALLALALELVAALVGMVVVQLALSNRSLIAVHYTIAMATLATLVVAVHRAGGFRASRVAAGADAGVARATTDRVVSHGGRRDASRRTYRGALAAAGLTLVTVVFGALTANLPGAAQSCRGFPWCRLGVADASGTLPVQLIHRGLATLLFLHLLGLAFGVARRGEPRAVVRAAWGAFGIVTLQLLIAAMLVELRLPPVLQSLHQATGTLLWVTVFALAVLARPPATPESVTHVVGVGRPAGAAA